jgi:hypothetical protein
MDAKKTVIFVVVGGVGLYLTYKYLDENGYLVKWFPDIFGPPAAIPPATGSTNPTPAPGATATPPASNVTPINTPPASSNPPSSIVAPLLDLSNLVVHADINDSFTGVVKINGKPVTLAIIQTDGRIFNDKGQEVTAALQTQGVDVNALRAAFTAAGSLSGLGDFNLAAMWAT